MTEPHRLYPLEDGLGFVELAGHSGGDLAVVNAARVSYGKRSEKITEKDSKLIWYLMRNKHGTPFEHAVYNFRVRAPLFVVHQWERHRIASYNEESGRYIELRGDFYTPSPNLVDDVTPDQAGDMRVHWHTSFGLYQRFLSEGMSRERARMVLPSSLYKEFWWTVNARSLMNFLELRNDDHAQWEIRRYAQVLEVFFAQTMPHTYDAFCANSRITP